MEVMSTPPFEGVRTVSKNTSQNSKDYKDYEDTPRDNAGTTGIALHTTMKRQVSRAEVETNHLVSRKG